MHLNVEKNVRFFSKQKSFFVDFSGCGRVYRIVKMKTMLSIHVRDFFLLLLIETRIILWVMRSCCDEIEMGEGHEVRRHGID